MNPNSITIITGLSGSGKSTAISALEDAGFYCVDNMPVDLLPKFLELPIEATSEFAGLVFGMDLREKNFISRYPAVFCSLRDLGYELDILFLEADEETLLRRYSQTRRHHPLSPHKGILEGVRLEKEKLTALRNSADRILDTSSLNVHELKRELLQYARQKIKRPSLRITVMSFGFKKGSPREADIVMDVRFLKNPYFVPELKNLDGETKDVADFVLNNDEARHFLKKCLDLLDYLTPLYEKEGKSYLTIAFGCTGGHHRSVAIARTVYSHIQAQGKQIDLIHRDKDE